jgi:hypothetical protein
MPRRSNRSSSGLQLGLVGAEALRGQAIRVVMVSAAMEVRLSL